MGLLVVIMEGMAYLAWTAPEAASAFGKLILVIAATCLLIFASVAALRLWQEKRDLALAAELSLGLSAAFFAVALFPT